MPEIYESYQGHFDPILPERQEWFSPKEMAAIIGKTDQYVRDAFENQKILGHTLNARAEKGQERRRSHQIHRNAVILYLLETANYEPNQFLERLKELIFTCSEAELNKLYQEIKSKVSQY